MAKNGASKGGGALATAAAELSAEVLTFESLTERLGRAEVTNEEQLTKAAELLGQAAQSHQRFLEVLRVVVTGVEDARQRQNASAVMLSNIEEALVARRGEYDALQQRFQVLGEAVGAVRELLARASEAPDEIEVAREKLGQLIEAAQTLAGDARTARILDLEQQGHAMFQQLESLSRKLARLPS